MAQTVTSPRATLADGFCLTEAPRWRDGKLYFSDVRGSKVHTVDLRGRVETLVDLPGGCSGLGFLPNGDLLVVRMEEATVIRVSDGEISDHADLKRYTDTEINDMVVDKMGRGYVTQLGPDRVAGSTAPRYTRVVIVEPDGSTRVGAEDLRGPNGIGISEDGRTLVLCEAGGGRLTAFDVAENGDLSGRRVFAELAPGECPDGMCLDAQGGAWAAVVVNFGPPVVPGPGFCRYDANGELTHVIPLEAGRHAVACAFGGEGRRTLFLCTTDAITGEAARASRKARIEMIEVEGLFGAGVP
jgi:sugar lactone lactonase YvrE